MAQVSIDPCYNKLKVDGTGHVKVLPDMAVVNLGVVTENKQLKLAQDENSEIMARVLEGLRNDGIPSEDIQTQNYNIYPQYDFVEGRQVFRAYRVEHILEVRVRQINKLGEIIDHAVQNGANQVSNVNFSTSKQSVYYHQALISAIDDAIGKARVIGRKLNVEMPQVPVQIVETGLKSEPPTPLMYRDVAGTTNIQTGQIDVTAQIEAIFTYKINS